MNARVSIAAACVGLLAASDVLAADGPLIITHGGTYSGHWTSDDASTPVVKIATKERVVLEHSSLVGRGTLIDAESGFADVIIRDVHGTGLNPNVPDRAAGRFFTGDQIAGLTIEHCQLDNTAGIYVHRTAGGDTNICIRCNDARNVDGRHSDGRNGYRPFNRRTRVVDGHPEEGFDLVQFVQFDQVANLAHGEISWNHVANEPGKSRVEDNISLYQTCGRPGSPIRVHDNCIVGAYTIDPSKSDCLRDGWQEDWSYSGGGIMLGDGAGKTLDSASGYIDAENNVVLSTGNYGIAVASGHDTRVIGNRVFGCGLLADGRHVMTQNVGIYVWDIAKGKKQRPPTFFGITGAGNVVGWMNFENRAQNDWWVPDASEWSDNVHAAVPVTRTQELREHAGWIERCRAAGVTVGMSDPAARSTTQP